MGIKVDVATVKVNIFNWALIGVCAATFILLGKILFSKFPIRGLTEFFHAI